MDATDITHLGKLSQCVTSTADMASREDALQVLVDLEGDSDYAGVLKSFLFSSSWKVLKRHIGKSLSNMEKEQGSLPLLARCASLVQSKKNITDLIVVS